MSNLRVILYYCIQLEREGPTTHLKIGENGSNIVLKAHVNHAISLVHDQESAHLQPLSLRKKFIFLLSILYFHFIYSITNLYFYNKFVNKLFLSLKSIIS